MDRARGVWLFIVCSAWLAGCAGDISTDPPPADQGSSFWDPRNAAPDPTRSPDPGEANNGLGSGADQGNTLGSDGGTFDGGSEPLAGNGLLCTDSAQCGPDEICFKLASDGHDRSSPPPTEGLCLKTCTDTKTPCSSSETHYHPCVSASTWDLGAVTVCAIACYINFGTAKTYSCPANTHCSRSFADVATICTAYP